MDYLKFLYKCSSRKDFDIIEREYFEIRTKEVDKQIIKDALISQDSFLTQLKPYMIDSLKRCSKLKAFKDTLVEMSRDRLFEPKDLRTILKKIKERDLLCALIETISSPSQPYLGNLISKNDYPVPIMYPIYDQESDSIKDKINFELYHDILSLSDKYIAIISGSQNAIKKGKSILIPSIFPCINKTSIQQSGDLRSVEIYCNDETSPDWLIADFNGSTETLKIFNLFKTFAVFSAIHVLNVTITDFKEVTLEPSDEIKSLLEWYRDFYEKNPSQSKTFLIVLLRDMNADEDETEEIEAQISKKLSRFYYRDFLKIKPMVNLKDSEDSLMELNELSEFFRQLIEAHLKRGNFKKLKKCTASSLKSLFKSIDANQLLEKISINDDETENRFRKFFTIDNMHFGQVFPLAKLKRDILYLNKEISNNWKDEKVVNDLKKQKEALLKKKRDLKPLTKEIQFFIELIKESDFKRRLMNFQKCLALFRSEKLSAIKSERDDLMLRYAVCKLELEEKEDDPNKRHDKDSLDNLRKACKEMRVNLQQLDGDIDDFSLTIEKFWDAAFELIDWNYENDEKKIDFIAVNANKIIDNFIEEINTGFQIHLLRGFPLKIESKANEMVFEKLRQENLLIVSVIGEINSGKSSLLNAIFGTSFKTESTTAGVYLQWANFEGRTIVLLDTQGLINEEKNQLIDYQIIRFAIFASHCVIVNLKKEVDEKSERLLSILFQAKLKGERRKIRPSLVFVLRDQINRTKTAIKDQAEMLRRIIYDLRNSVKDAPENFLSINEQNLFLLPNAFSQYDLGDTKSFVSKNRNRVFAEEILRLRCLILHNLTRGSDSFDFESFKNMHELYTKLFLTWEDIVKLGEKILSNKDADEITEAPKIIAESNKKINETAIDKDKKAVDTKSIKYLQVPNNDGDNDRKSKLSSASPRKTPNPTVNPNNEYMKYLAAKALQQKDTENAKQITTSEMNSNNVSSNKPVNKKVKEKPAPKRQLKLITKLEKIPEENKSTTAEENMEPPKLFNKALSELDTEMIRLFKTSDDLAKFQAEIEKISIELKENFEKNVEKSYTSEEHVLDELVSAFRNAKRELRKNYYLKLVDNITKSDIKQFFDYKQLDFKNSWPKNKSYTSRASVTLFSQDDVSLIMTMLETKVLPEIKRILEGLVKFDWKCFVSCFYVLIDKLLCPSDLSVLKMEKHIEMSQVMKDLVVIILVEIRRNLLKNIEEAVREEKRVHDMISVAKKEFLIAAFKPRKDSKQLGALFAAELMKVVKDTAFSPKSELLGNITRQIVETSLQSPQNLMHLVFSESFGAWDYEKIYKYCTNIDRFCFEVAKMSTVDKIDIHNEYELSLINEDIKICSDLDRNILSTHAFIDAISSKLMSFDLEFLAICFQYAKARLVDLPFNNFDQFTNGFNEKLPKKNSEFLIEIQNLFKNVLQNSSDQALRPYLGCNSKCPGCGTKCFLPKGHEKGHKTNKHILVAFNKWEKNSRVINCFCWDDSFLKNFLNIGRKTSVDEFLKERHSDWFSDIEAHIASRKYISDDMRRTERKIVKAWMNTKEAFIKKSRHLMDREKYETDWIVTIDEENMLDEDFEPTWAY